MTVSSDVQPRPAELLLIEDNHGDVLLTREVLRNAEITNHLTVAGDGEEALRMLKRRSPHADHPRPDLILLDLHLPRADGHQVLQSIRADPDLRAIPVVLLTGSSAEIEALQRQEPQADGYLTKPLDLDRLRAILPPVTAGAIFEAATGAEIHLADQDDDRIALLERELADFSYIVSHDIAAPIRHMAEFSRLFLAEAGDELTSRQQVHAEHIRAAGERCQAMLEQLLAFSRVQHRALRPVRQDATPAMRLALLSLAQEVESADAKVAIELLGECIADPDLLAMSFRHLLENAIKFRRPDVRPWVRVQAAHDDEFWRIRVSDNGVGVDPAFREKAFGMFQRLQGQEAPDGVGAGLAICRRIARRHGGEIRFLDCVEGACIELALPRHGAGP